MLLCFGAGVDVGLDEIEKGLDRLAVSIGFHAPLSVAKRNASHRHKNRF
jgi:hypothetical protein